MKQQVANYTVIIEKQKRLGTTTFCYTAYVPVLGIATDADTIENVEKEIKLLIQFHLKSLRDEGEDIPTETEHMLITRSEVVIPRGAVVTH